MRLWTFSDIHQEWADNAWDPLRHVPPQGFDAVAAPGDVCSPLTASIDWLADRFPGVPTIFTPGNHELWTERHDRWTMAEMLDWGRERAAARGVTMLLDETVTVGDVRFIGGILFTDFRLGSWSIAHGMATARRGMNDFRRIRRRPSGKHKYLRPVDALAAHRATRAFIDDALARPFDGGTVVVTHHAPHGSSLWDRFADLGWCYASDLTEMLEARGPDLWLHGHVHRRVDAVVGRTRIVANARGHAEEPSARAFDPSFVIEV